MGLTFIFLQKKTPRYKKHWRQSDGPQIKICAISIKICANNFNICVDLIHTNLNVDQTALTGHQTAHLPLR